MIPALQSGDLIAIVAPAKQIEQEYVTHAQHLLESAGYNVLIGEHCLGSHHYFSGTDEERLSDFQQALDNPAVKAILCARGGYGCIRIVDDIDWSHFVKQPKWIIGFSDITILHQRIQVLGFPSIHGTMPLNFQENSKEALSTLFEAIEGKNPTITIPSNQHNIQGEATGNLVGGNLSILYSLIGTNDEVHYEGTILFIEDLAEQLYHLDRMFYAFKKAGILNKIKGLIIGGMTDMKDTAIPFGSNLDEIILSHCQELAIPVAFQFPAGHINDNRALLLGKKIRLTVENETTLRYLD
jgi:muramoyltetrapeptide carboxypeptidase